MDKRVSVRRFIVPAVLAAVALCGTLGWSPVASAEETAAGGSKPANLVSKPADARPAAPVSTPASLVTKPATSTPQTVTSTPRQAGPAVVAPVRMATAVARPPQPAAAFAPSRAAIPRAAAPTSVVPRAIPVRLPAPTHVSYGLNGAPSLRR